MKKLLTAITIFICVISHAQKMYGGGSLGIAFGENWNGYKKEMESFAPKTIFVNIPFGFESKKQWLYEGNIMLIGSPAVGFSIGKQIAPFSFLIGCNDFISGSFKPIQMIHYFSPHGSIRIMFTQSFFLQTTYSNKTTFISLGLKT